MFFKVANDEMVVSFNNLKFEITASANTNARNCRDCMIRDIFDKVKNK
jgi:hypothetical protein